MRDYTWDTVGRFISLYGDGNKLSANCPFHEEQVSSFFVDQEKKTYYCFGCDAHGHLEDFHLALIWSRKISA
jgi:DNA primase